MDYNINFPHLGIYLDHVGKTIQLGGFSIAYYGIMVACGMLAGVILVSYVAKDLGEDPDVFFDLAIFDIIFGVIGTRLYYVAFRWDYYKDNLLSIFNLREGGLGIYGGIIAGIITTIIFSKVRKIPLGRLVDVGGFGVVLGQIVGRWGNFFNREAFGGYTNSLFAMQLPVSAVRSAEITAEQWNNMVNVGGIDYIQVHPTFLYEGLWNLGVLLLMFLVMKHRRFHGQVFLTYLCFYGIGRFWIENLRTDQLLLPGVNYPVSRALAAAIAVVTAIWLLIGCIRGERQTDPVDNSENSDNSQK